METVIVFSQTRIRVDFKNSLGENSLAALRQKCRAVEGLSSVVRSARACCLFKLK